MGAVDHEKEKERILNDLYRENRELTEKHNEDQKLLMGLSEAVQDALWCISNKGSMQRLGLAGRLNQVLLKCPAVDRYWCPRCEEKPKKLRPVWPELCKRCIQRENMCLYHNWPLLDHAPCICVGKDCLSEAQAQRDYPEYAHTWEWDEHPEDYEDMCFCADCRSYD